MYIFVYFCLGNRLGHALQYCCSLWCYTFRTEKVKQINKSLYLPCTGKVLSMFSPEIGYTRISTLHAVPQKQIKQVIQEWPLYALLRIWKHYWLNINVNPPPPLIYFHLSQVNMTGHFFCLPKCCVFCVEIGSLAVIMVFRLLTDFVCLYTYELWLSLCKIARSSVILLLPLLCMWYRPVYTESNLL